MDPLGYLLYQIKYRKGEIGLMVLGLEAFYTVFGGGYGIWKGLGFRIWGVGFFNFFQGLSVLEGLGFMSEVSLTCW